MGHETLELLARVNLVLAAAVALVLLARTHVRRLCGARVAYALWLIPLVAVAMCFAPGRVVHIELEAPLAAAAAEAAQPPAVVWAWVFGALVSFFVLAVRQARFTQALGRLSRREDLGARVCAAESVEHGPAVVGVLAPIIVTPADFEQRFDAEERRIVLAHERAHLAQGDPWINAVVLALQCLNWFNPLAHLGARALRIDQELACDEAVLAQGEGARKRYAETMLKTHLAAAAPIGCAWPSSDLATFKERIAMLKRNLPTRAQTLAGATAILLATGAAAAAAWAAQPPRVVASYAERPALPDLVQPISADDELEGGAFAHDYGDAFDVDLEGDGVLIIDGELVRARDLTPEERAELRRTLQEAREEVARARESMHEAMRARTERHQLSAEEMREIREAVAEAQLSPEELADIREAVAEARLSPEEIAEIRAAVAEAQLSQEDVRAIRLEALANVRESMREMEAELASVRVAVEAMPEVRAALRDAERELARAMADAEAAGDARRAAALERAARALEAARERDETR